MAKVPVAPNALQIQGTLERVHGAGFMMNIRLENGRIEFGYAGRTEMWREEQHQAWLHAEAAPMSVCTSSIARVT